MLTGVHFIQASAVKGIPEGIKIMAEHKGTDHQHPVSTGGLLLRLRIVFQARFPSDNGFSLHLAPAFND